MTYALWSLHFRGWNRRITIKSEASPDYCEMVSQKKKKQKTQYRWARWHTAVILVTLEDETRLQARPALAIQQGFVSNIKKDWDVVQRQGACLACPRPRLQSRTLEWKKKSVLVLSLKDILWQKKKKKVEDLAQWPKCLPGKCNIIQYQKKIFFGI